MQRKLQMASIKEKHLKSLKKIKKNSLRKENLCYLEFKGVSKLLSWQVEVENEIRKQKWNIEI